MNERFTDTRRYIRRKVFEEVARVGFESTPESLTDSIEAIPYKLVGEDSMYRDTIYHAVPL